MLPKDNIYDISNYLLFDDIKNFSMSNMIIHTIFKEDRFQKLIQTKYREYRLNNPELHFFDLIFDEIRNGGDIGHNLIDLIKSKLDERILKIDNFLSIYFNKFAERSFHRQRSLYDHQEILNNADYIFPLGFWKGQSNYIIVWTSKAELFAVSRSSVSILNINYQNRTIGISDHWEIIIDYIFVQNVILLRLINLQLRK